MEIICNKNIQTSVNIILLMHNECYYFRCVFFRGLRTSHGNEDFTFLRNVFHRLDSLHRFFFIMYFLII